jgi:Protein of unknown function (DUF3011)
MRILVRSALLLVLSCLCLAAASAQTMNCSSEDGKRHYCEADTRWGVEMVRQRSGSPCVEGYTWGYDARGVWVDRGCRADFALQPAPPTMNCSSEDGRRHYCPAEIRGPVQLIRQRSGSPCVKDQTWGYDDRGIWVDRGCRADFVILTAAYSDDENPPIVTCSSDDEHRHFCEADTRRGVRLVHQISGSACVEGRSWGYDDRGIWVDRGCRADFALRAKRRHGWDPDWDRDHDRGRDRDRDNN